MKKATLALPLLAALALNSCCMPYLRLNTAGALDNIGKTVRVSKPGIQGYYIQDGHHYALLNTYRARANESPVVLDNTSPICVPLKSRRYRLVSAQPEPWLFNLDKDDCTPIPAAQFDFSRARACTLDTLQREYAEQLHAKGLTFIEPESYHPGYKVFRRYIDPHDAEALPPDHYVEQGGLPADRTTLNKGLSIIKYPLAVVDFAATAVSLVGTTACTVTLAVATDIIAAPFIGGYRCYKHFANKQEETEPAH